MTEIPASLVFACDVCGKKHTEQLVRGRDAAKTPQNWMRLHIDGSGTRWSYPGKAVEKLLCESCGEKTLQAIERVEP